MADSKDVEPLNGTKATVAARLCNFPTGGTGLLPGHKIWLDTHVRPIVAANNGSWTDLIGHASRQWRKTNGANPHALNRQLSSERCDAVKALVKSYSASAKFNVVIATGDKEATGPRIDAGYDRAVEVLVYGSGKPDGPPAPAVPPSLAFEIRLVGGASMSVKIYGAEGYIFQIVDTTKRKTAFFLYTSAGLDSSPSLPSPGSVTKTGAPVKFATTKDAALSMFAAPAFLDQTAGYALGDWSYGEMYLTMTGLYNKLGVFATVPARINIPNGWGLSVPNLGSSTRGLMRKVSQDFEFTGY